MRIEALTIGDELLEGLTLDRNAAWLGQNLSSRGLRLQRVSTLPDQPAVLEQAFATIAQRADICLVTGGLGPTVDDLTLAALAATAGVELIEDATVRAYIEQRYQTRHGSPAPAHVARMALAPVGGRALCSQVGTAPCIELRHGRCTFYLMPGVPHEMRWQFDTLVWPAIAPRLDAPVLHTRRLQFALIGESVLAERLGPLPAGVNLAYRAGGPTNEIRISSQDARALTEAAAQVRAIAPEACFGEDDTTLADATIAACLVRGLTMGTAESCTGGLVGAALTDVPGASAVFFGGIISYANAVKHGALGVPTAVLETDGAVSEACARAMATGAHAALGVDIAVSITGIAGPGGGTPEKPVGTVWFSWVGPGFADAHCVHLSGDRARIRRFAVAHALDGVRRRLDEHA